MKLLVGNKCDLENNRQVKTEEGKELADSLNIKFLETSAKDAVNVEKAFITLSSEIRAKVKPRGGGGAAADNKKKDIVRGLEQKPEKKNANCC